MNFSLNLQTALAIIGALVVVAVYALSKWQSRRGPRPAPRTHAPAAPAVVPATAPRATGDAASPVADAMDSNLAPATELTEPAAELTAPAARAPAEPPPEVIGGGDPANARGSAAAAPKFAAADGFDRLSQIDYWVKITGERDLGRESALAIYRDAAPHFTKKHSIYGLRAPEKVWCNLENEPEGSRFADVVLTIQLADRFGAIDEAEMTRFSALVLRLSEGTGRDFSFMTAVENALAQARTLARFIAHFDASIVLYVRPADGGEFHGVEIDRCAAQLGLERDAKRHYSRFKLIRKTQATLYSLATATATGDFDFDDMQNLRAPALVFYTTPARNASPSAVFAEMADTAKAFAARIDGVVSSAEYADLGQLQVEAMRAKIDRMAAEMARLGLPAGGAEAGRIF